MSDKPDFELLSRFLTGDLPTDRAADIDRLIKSDPEWAAAYRLLRQLQSTGQNLDAATVESMSELARRLFSDFKRRQDQHDDRFAIRVFDSQVLPVPDGVRPASVDTRRLRYRLDHLQLELSLYPLTPESYELIGQLEGLESSEPVTIRLEQGRRHTSVKTDQFHLFRFERVETGSCRLVLQSANGVIGFIHLDL